MVLGKTELSPHQKDGGEFSFRNRGADTRRALADGLRSLADTANALRQHAQSLETSS